MLTDAQIDRYSRQIILPEVGGRGQERLRQSRLALAGDPTALGLVLPYLAGAGVGWISLRLAADQLEQLRASIAALNPDTQLEAWADPAPVADLTAIVLSRHGELQSAREIGAGARPLMLIRLLAPRAIAILHSRSRCLACADPALLAPESARTLHDRELPAEAIASAGSGEILLQLLGLAAPIDRLMLSAGYELSPRPLAAAPGCERCG